MTYASASISSSTSAVGERDGGLLLRGALGRVDPAGGDGVRPRGRGQRVGAHVAADDGGVGVGLGPRGDDGVGDLAAHRARGADAGVEAEEGHGGSPDVVVGK